MAKTLTAEGYKKRLNAIRKVRREYAKKNVDKLHVKLQKGNSKTGVNCYKLQTMQNGLLRCEIGHGL